MTKEEIKKAEYPMNDRGLGYRTTLETGPYFKDDVEYKEPLDNNEYRFCGACAFWRNGNCLALEEDIHILASCELFIDMRSELEVRHESLMRMWRSAHKDAGEQVEAPTTYKSADIVSIDDLEILELTQKYISKEDGKYCVRSHQTGKSFGCYSSRKQAEKRLGQIKGFKGDEVPEEDIEFFEKGSLMPGIESKDMEVKFASMDEDRKIVYGIVMEPDEVDSHSHTVTAAEIEKAAHKYAMTPMVIGDGHVKKAKAQPIETFIYNSEVLKDVKEGSWVMAVKVHSDKIWEGIKKGDYTGFSIGAYVRKIPLEEEVETNDS